jgi:hypothetical protein
VGPFEVFFGIFGRRIGTPTGKEAGGTVEEYRTAYQHWKEHGTPEILVYFNRVYGFPSLDELSDLRAVVEFKETIKSEFLAGEYDTEAELVGLARKHLIIAIRRLEARAAERHAADYHDDPRRPERPGAPEEFADESTGQPIDLVDVRLLLEAKLAWVNKHLTATYSNVGSLSYDGYLPRGEAERAARLLAFDPVLADHQDPAELSLFAQAVDKDVRNFRATVFDGYVRTELAEDGWTVEDFPQPSGYRPHFLAAKDGVTLRVAARLVTTEKSGIRDREVERLTQTRGDAPPATRRVVVIPDMSRSPVTKGDPQVVKLRDLLENAEA